MTKNFEGVDVDYFERKLARLTDDLHLYNAEELARELARLASVAHMQMADEETTSLHNKYKECQR